MDLLNVAVARSIWNFDLAELNNKGRRLYPDVIELIRDHYDFEDELDNVKLEDRFTLLNGQYQAKHALISVSLRFFSDGISAETTSTTDDSDAFLSDVLGWLQAELGMNYHPGIIKTRGYHSELVVKSDLALGSVCEKLQRFAEHLSALSVFGKAESQELASVYFGASEKTMAAFTFERKAGAPFGEHKFYSRAPFSTAEHLKLLRKFETMMADS